MDYYIIQIPDPDKQVAGRWKDLVDTRRNNLQEANKAFGDYLVRMLSYGVKPNARLIKAFDAPSGNKIIREVLKFRSSK